MIPLYFAAFSPLPSPLLSLLSRLESVGFWLADWPTDADLLNLREHSETPERCPIRCHVFLYKPTLCWCGCTAEQSGGKSSHQIFVSDPSAEGRRAQLDCVSHLTNRRLIQANYNTSTLKLGDGDRSQIPHLWNRVCLMNNAIIISTVDHRLKIHSAEVHSRLYGSVQHFSQWHKQIHYLSCNFPPVGTINESDFSSSQLSGTEQVELLKSHCRFTRWSQAKD